MAAGARAHVCVPWPFRRRARVVPRSAGAGRGAAGAGKRGEQPGPEAEVVVDVPPLRAASPRRRGERARLALHDRGARGVEQSEEEHQLEERVERDGPPLFTAEFFEAQMEVIIQERVPVYASGLGNPGPWMTELRANGTKVMAVVGAVRHAIQVKSSGLDIIVAQGHDGGGHNSPVGTMALIPQVVDAVGDTPVLGAGGITDGRGVAAALMLGAEGVWVGSAFLASEEANIFDFQKQAIVDSTEEGTSVSRTVTGKPARIIRSKWTEHWVREDVDPLPMPYQGMVSGPVMAAANRDGRGDINPGFAGQGIGMIKAVRPAKEIFDELVYGAEQALSRTTNLLG